MTELNVLKNLYQKGRGNEPFTVYSVARAQGISRYSAERMLNQLLGDGMLRCHHVFHRPKVTKRVFALTNSGLRVSLILQQLEGNE